MNPDKHTAYVRRLVSTARSIITYQVSLPLGCIRINKNLIQRQAYAAIHFPIFDQYLQATGELPKGTERLYWNRDSLREKDIQLEAINQKFRDPVFEACYEMLERFATAEEKSEKAK